MINFSTSKEDSDTIVKITERAKSLGVNRDTLSLHMDIAAAHMDCPLNLEELLKADKFDFLHDVIGIIRHLNRETGVLENYFLPRYAK